jgi:hypothetical protein
LLDRTKVQAEVLVPLYRVMVGELGSETTERIFRSAVTPGFRDLARQWVAESDGDQLAAFVRFGEYSNDGDPLETRWAEEQPPGELHFDVVGCAYARFFRELGEPELGFLLVCEADVPIADEMGMELHRRETLMRGGSHCDFRYTLPERSD